MGSNSLRVDESRKTRVSKVCFLLPKLSNSCFVCSSNFKRFCPVLSEGNKRNKRQKKIREEEIKLEISKLLQTLNNREFTISR